MHRGGAALSRGGLARAVGLVDVRLLGRRLGGGGGSGVAVGTGAARHAGDGGGGRAVAGEPAGGSA